MWSTPKSLNILAKPSPIEVAMKPNSFGSSETACSSTSDSLASWITLFSCCNFIFSIFIVNNCPNAKASWRTSPGVLVCTCTFIIPSSPTTTKLSPYLSILSRICISDILSVSSINSVQYWNFISSVDILFSTCTAEVSEVWTSWLSTNCPSNDFNIPSYTKTNPLPPESTTPASFKACSSSGVLFNELLASFTRSFINSIMSSSNTAAFKAYSELSLTTVNIVPSTGFITAL